MQNFFFALVGPSGSGKSELVKLMLAKHPELLSDIASFTTRAPRPSDQPGAYKFVTRGEFQGMIERRELIQWIEYGGNLYGDDHATVASVYARGMHVIRPMVEDGIKNFRAAGHRVVVIRIEPTGPGYRPNESGREAEDEARAKLLVADVTVTNSFEHGGLERAANMLSIVIGQTLFADAMLRG